VRFLYDHGLLGHEVLLLPGVAYQLRQFHGVMQHLARSAWIEHILRNPRDRWLLGASVDLEAFTFASAFVPVVQAKTRAKLPIRPGRGTPDQLMF
jgi:hypothetical protein